MLLISLGLAPILGVAASTKHAFSFHGSYVEGCTCSAPCTCELTGPEMGCQGVGAFDLKHVSFGGADISGVKTAYALGAGKWVILYIDGPAAKRKAATGFMRAALAAFGPVEAVKTAKISITGQGGLCRVTVNGGSVMSFSTTPMLGGDAKSPLEYRNTHDTVHPDVMQGKLVSGKFKDGKHSFEMKDSNAYFNDHIATQGKL
jgi:hypothetical protein